MTSLPTSGNIAVKVSISESLGTLTVPSPPALGLAAPANSETHCRTTPPVLDGAVASASGSRRSLLEAFGCVGVSVVEAVRAVVTVSPRASISLMREARVRLSGKTLFSRLEVLSSPRIGKIQFCPNLTILVKVCSVDDN